VLHCWCRKTMRWVAKWFPLLEWSRRHLSPCKVWGNRTTRAGCRCESMVFVCFLCHAAGLTALFVWGGHTLDTYCVEVYGSIVLFSSLFRRDWLSEWQQNPNFRRQVAPQLLRNCSRNCGKSKNWRKSLCAPLRIENLEIWIKFHCCTLGPRT